MREIADGLGFDVVSLRLELFATRRQADATSDRTAGKSAPLARPKAKLSSGAHGEAGAALDTSSAELGEANDSVRQQARIPG
jgi:hypothetical protein